MKQKRVVFKRYVQNQPTLPPPSLKELTLDGTKIEAKANRYTFVWGKVVRFVEESRRPMRMYTGDSWIDRVEER